MKSVGEIKIKINSLWKEVDEIQKNCKHLIVKTVLKADTGNYDRSQDRYWKEITCFACEKQWTEEQ